MNSRSPTHWMPTNFGSRRQVARGAWQDAARALNDLKWLVSEKWNIHPSTGVKVRFALLEPWTDATCHWVIPHQSEGPSAASQAPSQWRGLGFLGTTMESMDERIASRICDFLIFIVHARATCTYDVSSLTVCLIFKYFYSLESATWSEPRFFRCRFLFDFSIQLYQHTTPEPSTMWRNYGCVWDFTPEKHNYVVPFLITPPNKITRSLGFRSKSSKWVTNSGCYKGQLFWSSSLPSPKKRLKKPDQFAFFFEKKMQGGWKLVLRRCPSTESLHANCQTNMGKLWIKG